MTELLSLILSFNILCIFFSWQLNVCGLLVHAGQLSAYSENNILGKHRGFDDVLFNLWPLANAGFTDAEY